MNYRIEVEFEFGAVESFTVCSREAGSLIFRSFVNAKDVGRVLLIDIKLDEVLGSWVAA